MPETTRSQQPKPSLRTRACPASKRPARPPPAPWGRMGAACWTLWNSLRPRRPRGTCPASRHCGAPGSATTTGRRRRGPRRATPWALGGAARPPRRAAGRRGDRIARCSRGALSPQARYPMGWRYGAYQCDLRAHHAPRADACPYDRRHGPCGAVHGAHPAGAGGKSAVATRASGRCGVYQRRVAGREPGPARHERAGADPAEPRLARAGGRGVDHRPV